MKFADLGRVVGASAYELAVQQGYEGTLAEWLEGLKYDHSDEYKQLTEIISKAKEEIEKGGTEISEGLKAIKETIETFDSGIAEEKEAALEAIENAITAETDNFTTYVVTQKALANQSIDNHVYDKKTEIDTYTESKHDDLDDYTNNLKDSLPADYTKLNNDLSELKEDYSQLSESIQDISDEVNFVEDTVFDVKAIKIHDITGHNQQNALSTDYLWIPTNSYIPKGYIPIFTLLSWYGGTIEIVLLEKTTNGYKKKGSITKTLTAGGNTPQIVKVVDKEPFFDSDTYIGFYSQNKGIDYNTKAGQTEEYTRILYSDVSSQEFVPSGTYNMNFAYEITATKKTLKVPKTYVVVDVKGNGDYINVLDAMEEVKEGTAIYIKSGIYECDMDYCLKKHIILIGEDKNQCIIRSTDGRYGHHPLYVSCGYFENITVEARYVNGVSSEIGVNDLGAYAVHIDTDADYAVGKSLEFHHCKLYSDFFPAVGLGLRKDCHYIFDDCEFVNNQIDGRGSYSNSGSLGALYFHNTNGIKGEQYISVKNCILKSNLGYTLTPYQTGSATTEDTVHCEFINNVLKSNANGYSHNVWMRGDPFNPTNGRFIIELGYGNSNDLLNE